MASNDGPRYKMHPSRMQQLEEEAVAPKKTKQQRFGAHLFQKAAAENLQKTMSDKAEPPKKSSVHFTYTQGKRKKHLSSRKVQYHVVARKGKRKDRRKARREIGVISRDHKAGTDHDGFADKVAEEDRQEESGTENFEKTESERAKMKIMVKVEDHRDADD